MRTILCAAVLALCSLAGFGTATHAAPPQPSTHSVVTSMPCPYPRRFCVSSRAAAGAGLVAFSPWQNVLFGRWIAINSTVQSYSQRFGFSGQWTMQTFASESVMNPLAQGSQPDDRGIGQVGYLAEKYGRARGANPAGPDYIPGFDASGSIWDTKTNIALACIWYRWVYNQPYVHTPEQAYAVSTYGPGAILPDGTIRWDAQQRVNRAKSFGPLLSLFEWLKEQTRSDSWAQLVAHVPDAMTRDLLYINSHSSEGPDVYAQLSNRYLNEVRATASPWIVIMFGSEALTYLDEGRIAYGIPQGTKYQALATALSGKAGLFAGGGDLANRYQALLSAARSR